MSLLWDFLLQHLCIALVSINPHCHYHLFLSVSEDFCFTLLALPIVRSMPQHWPGPLKSPPSISENGLWITIDHLGSGPRTAPNESGVAQISIGNHSINTVLPAIPVHQLEGLLDWFIRCVDTNKEKPEPPKISH